MVRAGDQRNEPLDVPEILPDGRLKDGVIIHCEGVVVHVTELSARWMGARSVEEVLGRPVSEIMTMSAMPTIPVHYFASLKDIGDRTEHITFKAVRIDGSTSDADIVVSLIEWDGKLAYRIDFYEISRRIAAENTLVHELAMIEHASDALIATSFTGNVTSWNPAAVRMFGWPAEKAIGAHITEAADAQLDPLVMAPHGGVNHVKILRPDGSALFIRVSVATMHNGYVLVCADHTALRRAEMRTQSVLESLYGGFLLISGDGVVEAANPEAIELFGVDPRGLRWDDVAATIFAGAVDATGAPLPGDPTLTTRTTGVPFKDVVIGCERGPRDRIWVSASCRRLLSDYSSDTAVLLTVVDFTEHQLARQQLAHAATHDGLTGLYNRSHMVQAVDAALQCGRSAVTAVLFIDLDNLKRINDTMGHGAGDVMLQISARRLVDSLGPGDVVGRFGGDEFLCLLTKESANDLDALCARIHAQLSRPIDIDGTEVGTGASIGVRVLCGDEAVNVQTVLRDADAAMYQAKSAGRNQTRIFARSQVRQ